MTLEQLKEKSAYYELMKVELATKDYSEEINKKVEEYRLKLVAEKQIETAKDIDKIDCYLELLADLITETEQTSIKEVQNEVNL